MFILQKYPALAWESGKPLSFQKCLNLYFGMSKLVKFGCASHHKDFCIGLKEQKRLALRTLFPIIYRKGCVLLLVPNLAEPEWIMIPCQRNLLTSVWCALESHTEVLSKVDVLTEFCLEAQVPLGNNCILFVTYNSEINDSICTPQTTFHFVDMTTFEFLIQALPFPLPPLISLEDKKSEYFKQISYEKHLASIWAYQQAVHSSEASGIIPCVFRKKKLCPHKTQHMFQCKSGSFVSSKFLCDMKHDCPNDDSSDESLPICQEYFQIFLKAAWFGLNKTQPVVQNGILPLESSCNDSQKKEAPFKCNSSESIAVSLLNDLIPDCDSGKDELTLVNLLTFGNFYPCLEPYKIPCMDGNQKCYNISEVCFYKTKKYFLEPCRNGGHLESCKDFPCSAKFKCSLSYCIPWNYVCNGKWDCPGGEDEVYKPICQVNNTCVNMLKCQNLPHTCIHLGNICDGKPDCSLGDDEFFCNLKQSECPTKCQCTTILIKCVNFSFTSAYFSHHQFVYIIFIFFFDMTLEAFEKVFPDSAYLRLVGSKISTICGLSFPSKFSHLELSESDITFLSTNCIVNTHLLANVIIPNNKIHTLSAFSFRNLPQFQILNLSSNPIFIFPKSFIQNAPKFKTLYLLNTSISYVHPESFLGWRVQLVETANHHICCLVPAETQCTSELPWYKSCTNLLPGDKFRVWYGFLGFFIFLANLGSFVIYYLKQREDKKSFSVTVMLVNFCDGLCAAYFLVIWSADAYFGSNFVANEDMWKSGSLCLIACFIIIWCTILTQISLLFLSATRYLVVVHPLRSIHFKIVSHKKSTLNLFSLFMVISAVMSSFVPLWFVFSDLALPMRNCLPFVDPMNSKIMIKIFAWFAAIYQSYGCLLILILSVILAKYIVKKEEESKEVRAFGNKEISQSGVHTVICYFCFKYLVLFTTKYFVLVNNVFVQVPHRLNPVDYSCSGAFEFCCTPHDICLPCLEEARTSQASEYWSTKEQSQPDLITRVRNPDQAKSETGIDSKVKKHFIITELTCR